MAGVSLMTEAETALFWATLGGAGLGPFLAVLVTRIVDEWRERRDRQNSVFVALMTTRRSTLTAEHVQAVNRIEVEFSKQRDVLASLRAYMNLLEEPFPADQTAQDLLGRRRRRAFADLLQVIGRRLGRQIDRLDIIEGGYHPGGWVESETLQLQNLRLLNGILRGAIAFPIQVGPTPQNNPPAAQAQPAPPPAQSSTPQPQANPGPPPGSPFPPRPTP